MALPYRPFTENEFLYLGLELRSNGRSNRWKTVKLESQIVNFQAAYTAHPKTLAAIWHDLQMTPLLELRIDASIKPDHMLLAYRWLTAYESEKDINVTYGYGEKSIRKACRDVTAKIAALRKIKIDPNWEDDDGVVLGVSVDGVHYKIDEPQPFSTKYCSYKDGGPGLVYEIGLYTHKDKVAWLNGPYPAATHDRDVFRIKLHGAIKKKQEDRGNNFKVIVDDGYTANDLLSVCSLRNEFDPRELAWYKDWALSREEKFNGLTKCYKVLTKKFRHDRGFNPNQEHPRHKAVVEAICVTLQYELDLKVKKLFDPFP